jgi:hypothetical protein
MCTYTHIYTLHIQGGQSSSVWEAAPEEGPSVTRWKGDLIIEGGGFCGARTKPLEQTNWSAFDGIAMRVKGDGSIFKFNIKTVCVIVNCLCVV